MIFDETERKHGPIVPKNYLPNSIMSWAIVQKLFEGWSSDNTREIQKGWIKKANTLEDLAKMMGINPEGLATTVRSYNEYKSQGKDPDFKRPAKTLLPIVTPPYYTVELGLTVINTQGGPVHNAKAQVLDTEEKPIPRLYAAGELGSFCGKECGKGEPLEIRIKKSDSERGRHATEMVYSEMPFSSRTVPSFYDCGECLSDNKS
jgi:hypothetical protein